MNLERSLVESLPVWLSASGLHSDLVISSRVRLARNFQNHKFVRIADDRERAEIHSLVAGKLDGCPSLSGTRLFSVDSLTDLDRQFLVERHLISLDMQKQGGRRGILVNPDQTLGIMINEEDHLRLQSIQSGFNLQDAWNMLSQIDDELSRVLPFAFSERWGYLTACPTNTGTGMRISVLIHLPALVLTKNIDKVIHGINQIGLSVRGFYGEGSDVLGNLFQISNQTTLGKKEQDIMETIDKVIQQIIGYEKNACQTLLDDAKPQIEDKIWRSYGILRSARLMNTNEFMSISSAVRLGIALGIITDIKLRTLNELMTLLAPAHLQINFGKEMNPTERDILRAQIIRERLN